MIQKIFPSPESNQSPALAQSQWQQCFNTPDPGNAGFLVWSGLPATLLENHAWDMEKNQWTHDKGRASVDFLYL